MKSGQKGFTVVEALLVLILLSIVGFTGYYVYHSRNNANSTYSNAANSASDVAASHKSNTLTFTNLGVKIILNDDKLKDLKYSPNPQYPDISDNLTTSGYSASAKACDPSDPGNFGLVTKRNGTYDSNTALEINLKQFNGFWIAYSPSLGQPCQGEAGAQLDAIKADLKTALTQAFQTAQLAN